MFAALRELRQDPKVAPYILDIRGKGLMVGIEFASSSAPSTDLALNLNAPSKMGSRIVAKCLEKGMLILATSVFDVIRFIPPLNITEEDLTKGCEVFKAALLEVVHEG